MKGDKVMIKFFIEYYLDKFDSDFGIQEIEVDSDCINKAAWVEAFRQANLNKTIIF